MPFKIIDKLLKNSFYTYGSNYEALETLPNIDINIKEGNSLLSRFELHKTNLQIQIVLHLKFTEPMLTIINTER